MDTNIEFIEVDNLQDTKENVDAESKDIEFDVLKTENVVIHTIVDASEDSVIIDLDSDNEENNITDVDKTINADVTEKEKSGPSKFDLDLDNEENNITDVDKTIDADVTEKEKSGPRRFDLDSDKEENNITDVDKTINADVTEKEKSGPRKFDLDSDNEENNITDVDKTIDADVTEKEERGPSTCSLDSDTEEIKNICDNELIIYTKKLDDMIILNTTTANQNVSFKKIMNSIELESKPKLNEVVNKKTINQRFKKILDFNSLQNLIEILSKKTNSDSLNTVYRNRNNRPILNMCKRVNITLIDYRLYSKMTNLKGSELHDKIYRLTKSIQARSRRMYRKNHQSLKENNYLFKTIGQNSDQIKTKFSLLDSEMKKIEHYLINAFGEIVSVENVDLSHDNNWEDLKKSHSVYEVCCWYKRESLLNSLCKHVKHLPVFRMISKKHNCPIGICKCCKECKANSQLNQLFPSNNETFCPPSLISLTNIDKSRMKLKDLLNTKPRMFSIPIKPKTLIDKALAFSRSHTFKSMLSHLCGNIIHDAETNVNKIKQNWMRNKIIIVKSTERKLLIEEIYDIGNDGELLACHKNIKKTENSTFLHSDKFDLSKKLSLYKVCCWNKRENLIDELLTMNLSPDTAKQIRQSHSCAIDDCKCCCYKIDRAIDKIVYPHSPREQNTEVARMCKYETSMNRQQSNSRKAMIHPKSKKRVMKHQKKSVESIINEVNEGPNISPMKSIVDQEITKIRKNTATTNTKTYDTLKRNNNISQQICTTNTAVEKDNDSFSSLHNIDNANPKHDESKAIHIDPQIMVKINQIVNDMLVKFQNIQLSTNGTGQVTVLMNDIENVDDLSIFEVTFLKQILSQTQDIVNTIAKSPEKDINDIIGVRSRSNQPNNINIPIPSQTQINISESKNFSKFHNYISEMFGSKTNSDIDLNTNVRQYSATNETSDAPDGLIKNIILLPKKPHQHTPETINIPHLSMRPRFFKRNSKKKNSSNRSRSSNLSSITNSEEFINKQMQFVATPTSGNETKVGNMVDGIAPITKFSNSRRHPRKQKFPAATVVQSEPTQNISNVIADPNNYFTLQDSNLQYLNINPPLLSNVTCIPNEASASLPLLSDINIQKTSTFNLPIQAYLNKVPIPRESKATAKKSNVDIPNSKDNSGMIKMWYKKPDYCDNEIESLKRQILNDFEDSNFKKIKLPLLDPSKETREIKEDVDEMITIEEEHIEGFP